MRKLRIAQIAPMAERVPPKKYGGAERMVHALTEELVGRGHDVTLFASGDSVTHAKLSSVYPRGLREGKVRDPHGLNPWTLFHIGSAYLQQENFDIIHDHSGIFSLPTAQFAKTPTVFTLHGPITPTNKRHFITFTNPHLVAISDAQVRLHGDIDISAIIHHGLPLENYPFGKEHKGYLLFVGRISMEKGLHTAIDIALEFDIPLVIAAKLDKVDRLYFKEYIEPRLSDDLIRWVGEVDEVERNKLMSEAMCLLNPITWREPFGLVMIEAMACGTPVVTFNKGSAPEIVENGRTGFVVNHIEEMIEAVRNISYISREECRMRTIDRFNVGKMTSEYEDLYYKILYEQLKLPYTTPRPLHH